MSINQYNSRPDLPAAATPPGIGERLARLTAADDKLKVHTGQIEVLTRQLGGADLLAIQQHVVRAETQIEHLASQSTEQKRELQGLREQTDRRIDDAFAALKELGKSQRSLQAEFEKLEKLVHEHCGNAATGKDRPSKGGGSAA